MSATKLGVKTGKLKLEDRKESGSPSRSSDCLGLWLSRKCLLLLIGLRQRDGLREGAVGDLPRPLGMGPEMVCCTTGDKIWGLELEGRKESKDCLLHFLANVEAGFQGMLQTSFYCI